MKPFQLFENAIGVKVVSMVVMFTWKDISDLIKMYWLSWHFLSPFQKGLTLIFISNRLKTMQGISKFHWFNIQFNKCSACSKRRGELKHKKFNDVLYCFFKDEIDAIVFKHNELRAKVANCNEKRAHNSDAGQPCARNMNKLTWDPELAKVAQRWAQACDGYHDKDRSVHGYHSVGQNYAASWASSLSNLRSPQDSIQAWYDEVIQFLALEMGLSVKKVFFIYECHFFSWPNFDYLATFLP